MIEKLKAKHLYILIICAVLCYSYITEQGTCLFDSCTSSDASDNVNRPGQNLDSALTQAYKHHRSGVQVQGEGIVSKLLSDDLKGSRHQRFILRTSSNLSLLIAHNIDIAPRVNNLKVGDQVAFFGEYEWNEKGGVVHWTHRDLRGRHVSGWLRHNKKMYK